MLHKIIEAVKSLFKPAEYGNELERFIVSHNPQDNSHVESLEREFDRIRSKQNTFYWARGF